MMHYALRRQITQSGYHTTSLLRMSTLVPFYSPTFESRIRSMNISLCPQQVFGFERRTLTLLKRLSPSSRNTSTIPSLSLQSQVDLALILESEEEVVGEEGGEGEGEGETMMTGVTVVMEALVGKVGVGVGVDEGEGEGVLTVRIEDPTVIGRMRTLLEVGGERVEALAVMVGATIITHGHPHKGVVGVLQRQPQPPQIRMGELGILLMMGVEVTIGGTRVGQQTAQQRLIIVHGVV